MKISVLISIYHKEKAEWFNRSMLSIWDEQTVKPDEIVLVEDGPLNEALYLVISDWKERLGDVLKCIPLKDNVGLGKALAIGVEHCAYELIARMDTDDISLPTRFEKQINVFQTKQVDVCSAWITEFNVDEKDVNSIRKIPETHDDIFRYGKFRNPVNHVPVMFKKSVVLLVGNYSDMRQIQDYELWSRLLVYGARFYNIQEPLAHIRAGERQLDRRFGLTYAKREFDLLKKLRNNGYLSRYQFTKSALIKVSIRIMPKFIVRFMYKLSR